MSSRTLLWLLAFANFVIGMGAFVVIGVLTPIASDYDVSPPTAGWLMTAYALTYAFTSPVLVALTGRVDRAHVLIAGLALFTLGALAVLAAPGFATLLLARGLMALGGGLVTPVAASIAAASVAPEHRGAALATIFGGLTLAQVFGIPVGAWLGYAFGWRMAFVAVAALSAVGLALLTRFAPRGLRTPLTTLSTLAEVLRSPRLLLAISFTALFVGGLYVLYTYFTPFLETRYGLRGNGVTIVLVIYGIGATLGNTIGGFLADRIGSFRTLVILCLAQLVLLPFLTLVETPLVVAVITLVVWSAFTWSFMAPQQTRLVALDPPRTPVLFALNASAIYIGGSIGSLIGGATLHVGGFAPLGPVAALIAMLALGVLVLVERTPASRPASAPLEGAA
jgi:DHA1 family inner membrane transport protein